MQHIMYWISPTFAHSTDLCISPSPLLSPPNLVSPAKSGIAPCTPKSKMIHSYYEKQCLLRIRSLLNSLQNNCFSWLLQPMQKMGFWVTCKSMDQSWHQENDYFWHEVKKAGKIFLRGEAINSNINSKAKISLLEEFSGLGSICGDGGMVDISVQNPSTILMPGLNPKCWLSICRHRYCLTHWDHPEIWCLLEIPAASWFFINHNPCFI